MTSDLKQVNSVEELWDLEQRGALLGLIRVPNEAYHAGPGVSSTDLKKLLESPAHYKAHKKNPPKRTPALVKGNLIHLAVLEPELFKSSVVIMPSYGRSKADQAEKDAFLAANAGKELVDADDYEEISYIAASVKKNPMAAKLLSGEYTEVSVYWKDEKTGVLCKARADHINGDTIIDLKSTHNSFPKAFNRQIEDLQYHLSAAHYLEGFKTVLPVSMFAWLAVEKSHPYCCRFFAALPETIESGQIEQRKALNLYAECLAKNKWPGYPMKFEPVLIKPNYEGVV